MPGVLTVTAPCGADLNPGSLDVEHNSESLLHSVLRY